MKGKENVIKMLNNVLTKELTAINQYFLHARILENWGYAVIGKYEYKASISAMKLADNLIKRILFLEGLPNLQKLERIRIGQETNEILKSDLNFEKETIELLKTGVELCEVEEDFVSREMLQDLLTKKEEHYDWIETQLSLWDSMGEKNYLQSQTDIK